MVLVRVQTKSPDSGKAVVPSGEAMRLLAQGRLGSRLVAMARTAAAIHMARSVESAVREAKR